MKYLALITCSLFLFSCKGTDKEKENIIRLVSEWQGKMIVFPPDLVFTRYATDTVDYQTPESEYKVLIYIDSLGCMGCSLQLPKWKELIAYTDSLTGASVPFLFFFHPNERGKKEIYFLLESDKFDRPVCIDTEDDLNRLNHFPAVAAFQTFLLDRENKVAVIGNPVSGPAVRKLYLKQIQGTNNQGTASVGKKGKNLALHWFGGQKPMSLITKKGGALLGKSI
jgi:hypothetical protein